MPKTAGIPVLDRSTLSYEDDELIELAARIQELKNHPAWSTYAKLLQDAIVETQRLGFQNLDEILRWKGRAEGLQQAWELPTWVIEGAERILNSDQARAQKGGPLKTPRRRDRDDDELTS